MAVALSENCGEAGEGAQAGAEPARDRVPAHGCEGRRVLGDVATPWSSTARSGPTTRQFEIDGIKVVVDKKSYLYLNGTTLDYVTAGADGRLHLRQSPGEVELWLRHVVLGVAGPGAHIANGPGGGPVRILADRSGGAWITSRCSACRGGSASTRAELQRRVLRAVAPRPP